MTTVLRSSVWLAFTGIVLLGQTKPKDVYGWGKIRWGMTVAQAKAAYGSQAQESDGQDGTSTKFTERLAIKSFAVGDVRMKVSIETMPGSQMIKEVSLTMEKDQPQSSTRTSAYEDMKNSLMQKYGRPTDQQKDQGERTETNSATWTFPSTVISLFWVEAKGIPFGVLTLQYTATDKKARDVL